jgi:hypothetical protein
MRQAPCWLISNVGFSAITTKASRIEISIVL